MEAADGRIFTASFEQNDTRTYVEDGNLLRWNAGDLISIFDGNTLNRKYQFDGATGDNSGTFSIVSKPFGTGNDLNCHYSVYPYASGVKITENGVITATLPADQNYGKNSFGIGANTMVAVTKDLDDTFLKFKNVCGYLKLYLYGEDMTIKSITLNGNNNEKIAGKSTITTAYGQEPTVVMGDEATTSITLNCDEGTTIGSTEEMATAFWIVVPPTTFKNGFTITITDVNGKTFIKETSNEIAIERNVIKPMKAFEVTVENEEEEDGIIPNNQIWYTATAKVEPYWDDVFGANIVSNTWNPTSGNGIITFDSDVTSVGTEAFLQSTQLTSIILPKSVTTIGVNAFGDCYHLTDITIPYGVTKIEGKTFFNCQHLEDITIPNSITEIGEGAFMNCLSFTNIIIPDSVTTIGADAFDSCWKLKSVTIGENVTTIGAGAFPTEYIEEFKGKFASNDGRCLIIENSIHSFASAGLKEYTIPNNIQAIGNKAFKECTLTHITIPESVTRIESMAFSGCYYLTDIEIPDSVTEIGDYAFITCRNLESVTLSTNITAINWGTFQDCGALSSIIIPDGVTTIQDYAFMSCEKLKDVVFGNEIQYIGSNAFSNCKNLSSVTIPDCATYISYHAFANCSRLESVTLGKNINNICDGAFAYCHNLLEMKCMATTPPEIDVETFYECNSDLQIYVPEESLDAYKTANYWKDMNIKSSSQFNPVAGTSWVWSDPPITWTFTFGEEDVIFDYLAEFSANDITKQQYTAKYTYDPHTVWFTMEGWSDIVWEYSGTISGDEMRLKDNSEIEQIDITLKKM